MYKKLVKIDSEGGFSEVDPIALQRTAQALREFALTRIDPQQDPYNIRGTVLELCDGVMNGSVPLPLSLEDDRLNYMRNMDRFGLMPSSMFSLWADFSVTAYGGRRSPMFDGETEINGELYAYMDFEEPGDWPHVVKQREKEISQENARQVAEDERLAAQKKPSSS